MNKNNQTHSDEIDFINLLKIIWSGKNKILLITIISISIGFGYSNQIRDNHINSLVVKPSNSYLFNKFFFIKKYLETPISNQNILDRFIYELQDYEEFLFYLKKTKQVTENISKLNIKDQEKDLFKYATLLEIVKLDKAGETEFILNFKWDNKEEAIDILQNTINLTLKNLEKSLYDEIEQSLELEKINIMHRDTERLQFLLEQSSIAIELDIVDNQLNNSSLSQVPVLLGTVENNNSTTNIAYYLRGFKAINKEIELIKNRKYQKFQFIKQEINSLKKDSINWVNYNIYLIETKSLKHTKLIIQISILLGLIVGVFYVLISSAFKSHTASKKTY
jgi:LPS O-antigen subunit length determinant protein (WzzB/FepE family)